MAQVVLSGWFVKNIWQPLENNFNLLQLTYSEFNHAHSYFSLKRIWRVLYLIYRYTFFLFVFLTIYHISFTNSINLFSYILSNVILLFVFKIICLFTVINIINALIVIYTQKSLISYDKNNDIVTIKKIISTFVLCYKPYKIFTYILSIIIILGMLGVSVTALLASTSIITVIIAFGAKDILQNFFNAILFLSEGSFFINDLVEVSGKLGVVEDISLVYIKIRDLERSIAYDSFF